jgi:hypothetical protein
MLKISESPIDLTQASDVLSLHNHEQELGETSHPSAPSTPSECLNWKQQPQIQS